MRVAKIIANKRHGAWYVEREDGLYTFAIARNQEEAEHTAQAIMAYAQTHSTMDGMPDGTPGNTGRMAFASEVLAWLEQA